MLYLAMMIRWITPIWPGGPPNEAAVAKGIGTLFDFAAWMSWLLLIHHLSPKPDYFRVKIRCRLHEIGAARLKDPVYLLPTTEQTMEDFIWLRREIMAERGEAVVCEVEFVEGMSTGELKALLPGGGE